MCPQRRVPRHDKARRNDRALLEAAREVVAVEGSRASVAAIAARAGVGIGTLYRRYRTKEELFQHLISVTLDLYLEAAQASAAIDDEWEAFTRYVTSVLAFGPGWTAPLAGTVSPTVETVEKSRRADEAVAALVDRAHAAGVLRADANVIDVELLIEQLAKSPLVDQLADRPELADAVRDARARMVTIALDGLRATGAPPLPGSEPTQVLFSARWERPEDRGPL